MKGSRAASRYAKSLLEFSVEKKQQDAVYGDMTLISELIRESRDLELLLKSPIVKTDQKQSILNTIFDGKIHEITANFINILTRKRREELLGMIAEEYAVQYKTSKNIITAEVVSAIPIDAGLREKILDLIRSDKKQEVDLREKVSPGIIGGLIVRVGDQQVDASISRKIKELKKEFSKNPYVAEL